MFEKTKARIKDYFDSKFAEIGEDLSYQMKIIKVNQEAIEKNIETLNKQLDVLEVFQDKMSGQMLDEFSSAKEAIKNNNEKLDLLTWKVASIGSIINGGSVEEWAKPIKRSPKQFTLDVRQ